MSIIIDALKKAEKDRSGQPVSPQEGPPFSPKGKGGEDPKKNKRVSLRLIVPLLIVALMTMGGAWYFKFHRNKPSPIASDPIKTKETIAKKLPEKQQEFKGEPDSSQITQAIELFEMGEISKSLQKWEELKAMESDNPVVLNNYGLALKKSGKKQPAEKAYLKALEKNPNYPEALNNLGALYAEMSLDLQAIDLLKKALTLKQNYPEPYFHLGFLYERQGNIEEALTHYKNFLTHSPLIHPQLKGQIEMRISILEFKKKSESQFGQY